MIYPVLLSFTFICHDLLWLDSYDLLHVIYYVLPWFNDSLCFDLSRLACSLKDWKVDGAKPHWYFAQLSPLYFSAIASAPKPLLVRCYLSDPAGIKKKEQFPSSTWTDPSRAKCHRSVEQPQTSTTTPVPAAQGSRAHFHGGMIGLLVRPKVAVSTNPRV